MVEENRDPFDFDEDPLAGADELEIPSFGAEVDPLDSYRDSAAGVETTGQAPPSATPPAGGPAPGQGFPPPAADTAYPGAAPTAPASSFPPPGAPPSTPAVPVDASPPSAFPPPGAPPAGSAPPGPNFADFPPPSGSAAIPPQNVPGPQPPGIQPPPGVIPPGQGAPPTYSQNYGGIAPPAQKKGKGCLFWGVIVSLIFAVLIGGCVAYIAIAGQSGADSANAFLDAVESNDFEGAADQSNSACGLSAGQIEADLGGMTDHFLLAIGPIVSGEVNFGSESKTIVIELQDDLVCRYELADQ